MLGYWLARSGRRAEASKEPTGKSQQGSVPAMWSSLLGLALLAGLDPVRLGITLLLISRPRPLQNLLAYWVGCLASCIPTLVIPLTLLHVTPTFRSFTHDVATPASAVGSTVRHIQLGMGVLVLSIAALMAVRSLTRRRQRAYLATPGGNTSALVLDSDTPTAISRLLRRAQDAPAGGGSAIRRLLRRAHDAWENGSLWVAVVIAFGYGGPPPSAALFVLAIIMASGAAIGMQVSATIAFVVGTLAVVEITLASYLATPAKTQAVLQLLHEWTRAHRQKILIAMSTVGGVALVASGIGSV
jgi:hypothetical protein